MFFPYIKDKIVLNIHTEDFFYFLEKFVNSMPSKEPLEFLRKNQHTAVILSNKISLFRRYNISKGEFTVFEISESEKKIEISYKISYTKWFLGMIFISFMFLLSMSVFYFAFLRQWEGEIHIFQNMFLMFNVLFWVVLWPVIMNIFYGITLRRLFKTLFLSFEFKKR